LSRRAPVLKTIGRGLSLRCPACGGRGLFRAYLKLNRACPACGADFSRSETADVAPYLTVFFVGLITVPAVFVATMGYGITSLWAMGGFLALAVILALLLLPRIKGMLAALLWRAGREM
jgi:uncharacterized protein (DUF983 family)